MHISGTERPSLQYNVKQRKTYKCYMRTLYSAGIGLASLNGYNCFLVWQSYENSSWRSNARH